MTTRIPSRLDWFVPALAIASLLWSGAVPQAQDRAQSKPQAQDDEYARLVKAVGAALPGNAASG